MVSPVESTRKCTGSVWCNRGQHYGKAAQSGGVVREDGDFGNGVPQDQGRCYANRGLR